MVVSGYSLDMNNFMNTAVFQVTDTACFLWKSMDDAHIIYDTRSGHSQALNDFAREIFAIIEERPRHMTDIVGELEKILERPLGDELRQQVQKTVAEFDKMGLIEPVKPE
ncbi:hypothetical protein MNBD_ALPHA01-676 [hydrothermal vent metagenome]|uniref:Uncharacterized protein n=1 Tax=hydrothermal vent metagenome TaxID=652676 RepID=A0A3B0SBP8_9ZZZZ